MILQELLLKWGGDPRCRVVFPDSSDGGTLASELRSKYARPPVVAAITRPCPAISPLSPSMRIGFVQPNSLMLAAICAIWASECVREFEA